MQYILIKYAITRRLFTLKYTQAISLLCITWLYWSQCYRPELPLKIIYHKCKSPLPLSLNVIFSCIILKQINIIKYFSVKYVFYSTLYMWAPASLAIIRNYFIQQLIVWTGCLAVHDWTAWRAATRFGSTSRKPVIHRNSCYSSLHLGISHFHKIHIVCSWIYNII